MASIRKRGDKFQVQVRRFGCRPLVRSFHKRSDALEWARTMELRADRKDLPPSVQSTEHATLAPVIERYRDEISVRKKSYDSEVFILNALLRTRLAGMALSQITVDDFESYREKRLKTVKAGTVNRELGIIKHALDIAMKRWGVVLKENPLAHLEKLKAFNARNRRLQAGEIQKIQEALSKTQNRQISPVIFLALETGMRRGEIIKMEWQNIDFAKRTLLIPETKNGHSRTIPLSVKAISILENLNPKPNGRVFSLTANSIRLSWDRLMKRAQIEDLHFHDLRHEAISRFFEKGLSIPEVALISGHRDFRMLFRYTHLKAEDLAKKM